RPAHGSGAASALTVRFTAVWTTSRRLDFIIVSAPRYSATVRRTLILPTVSPSSCAGLCDLARSALKKQTTPRQSQAGPVKERTSTSLDFAKRIKRAPPD